MVCQHYEKVIIGCCFAFIFSNVGLASTSFSVHLPYLVAMQGVGDTGGSLILSARTLVSLLVMLVVDRYYNLLDVRHGVFFACVFSAAGFFVYSIAQTLPMFIGGAVLLGVGYGLGGMVAVTMLANRWFASGIGSVIGIASMGSGLASIVMPLIVVHIIEASSLSAAFVVEGAIPLIIGLTVFALIRNRPSDLALEPYTGKSGKRKSRKHSTLRPASKWDRRILMLAMVFVGVFCCGGITYMSVLATTSGFDTVFAAMIVSIAGIALTISKFVTGGLFDFLGVPHASAVVFALGAVGFALCCFAGVGSALLMVVAAALVGAGLSLGTVGISMWPLEISTDPTPTRDIRNFQVAYSFGGFIANTLPGIVKDLVGSYIVPYVGMLAVLVAAGVILLRYYRKYSV